MGYKDKDKQREANPKAQAKFKAKGITNCPPSGITSEGITEKVLPPGQYEVGSTIESIMPDDYSEDLALLPADFGLPNCTCRHCQNNRASGRELIINHGAYKSRAELGKREVNRVSMPGDFDYEGSFGLKVG